MSGPAQVWAIDGPAGFDGASRELLVLSCDVRLIPEVLMSFSGALARWVVEKKLAFSLALEGADAKEFPEGIACATTHPADGALQRFGIAPHEGVHAGFNAAFLARFNQHRLAAAGIFVPVAPDSAGDAQGALVVLEAIAPLLPRDVATGDLPGLTATAAKRAAHLHADQFAARADLEARAKLDPSYL